MVLLATTSCNNFLLSKWFCSGVHVNRKYHHALILLHYYYIYNHTCNKGCNEESLYNGERSRLAPRVEKYDPVYLFTDYANEDEYFLKDMSVLYLRPNTVI